MDPTLRLHIQQGNEPGHGRTACGKLGDIAAGYIIEKQVLGLRCLRCECTFEVAGEKYV